MILRRVSGVPATAANINEDGAGIAFTMLTGAVLLLSNCAIVVPRYGSQIWTVASVETVTLWDSRKESDNIPLRWPL